MYFKSSKTRSSHSLRQWIYHAQVCLILFLTFLWQINKATQWSYHSPYTLAVRSAEEHLSVLPPEAQETYLRIITRFGLEGSFKDHFFQQMSGWLKSPSRIRACKHDVSCS